MDNYQTDIKKVVLWGASGHALAVENIMNCYPELYQLVGYIDDVNIQRHGSYLNGKKILGGIEQFKLLGENDICNVALGFGHCAKRIEIGRLLIDKGFDVLTLIHPNAIYPEDRTIGKGSVILAGAIIDPDVQIGEFCIINNNTVISHGCRIQEGVHLCPGAHLAGNVKIGKSCWIGIGTTIIDCITIGDGSFIGAGSVVTKDIPPNTLAHGNPAKVIRPIEPSF